VTDDGSGGEMVACAINITHQMFIDVSLPRHFVSLSLVVVMLM